MARPLDTFQYLTQLFRVCGIQTLKMIQQLPLLLSGYVDASYMRLKNVQIGYTLPDRIVESKQASKKQEFFGTGKDLLTFTKFYKWVDPEAPLGGNSYTYPMVMVNSIGINLTF